MRDYLQKFFEEFQYEASDIKVLLENYDTVMSDEKSKQSWNELVSLYEQDINCDFTAVLAQTDVIASRLKLNEYTLSLLIFICMSKHLRKVYEKEGMSDEVYVTSMLDLRYKLEECKLVKGIVGSFVASWFAAFFQMKRFGFGRLQFNLVPFNREYNKDGIVLTPESLVVTVHIPRGGTPLTEENCRESYKMAKEYFKNKLDTEVVFVCHSWLLYPEHKNFLPKHTNTYKFMMSFDVFEESIDKDRRNLWRLFDTDEQNIEKLPYDTSIRRAYVDHLRNGGKCGVGYGVLKKEMYGD